MQTGPGLPLLVDVTDRLVVVVGGGEVAQAKTRSLLAASARLLVIAPDAKRELVEATEAAGGTWRRRAYVEGDLEGAWLVVAATSSPEVNAAVVAEANRRHLWCVRVDDAARGSGALLATIRRGPLLMAVSTSGRAPALAAFIRGEIGRRYGDEWGELAELMGELRHDPALQKELAGLSSNARRRRWRAIIDADIVALIRTGRRSEAKEVATACLCSSSD